MATWKLHPVVAAVASVSIAGALQLLLHPLLASDAPLLVFVVAVVVSALYGGAKAGLLATALSVLVGSSLFASPIWGINGVNTSELVRIVVFVAEGVLVAWLVARIDAEHHQLLSAKAEAESAKRLAEEASSAKDAFLAMISHELRTPLNVILGYARLLRGKEAVGPERVRQVAAIIERNAVMRIPAHPERPFRSNVNADSDRC